MDWISPPVGSCKSEGLILNRTSLNAKSNFPQRGLRRLRADLTTVAAIFAHTADTPSGAAAGIANGQQHLLAILELIQRALCQFGLFGVRRRREERARHHLT